MWNRFGPELAHIQLGQINEAYFWHSFLYPAAFRYQPPECRGRAAFRIAEGTLVGAAVGWLGYELAVGIWVSGEGAKPDASMRRLRTALILSGATFGAVRTMYIRRQCRSWQAPN